MSSEVKLPRLGQGMETGTIVKWLKAEGERVEKGEPLFEVETEKATQEVEAELSGVLLRIAVVSGDVPVGQTIAVIGEPGEALEEPAALAAPANGASGARPAAAAPRPPARMELAHDFRAAISGARSPGRIKASPLARRRAEELGVDLRQLSGTGPEGRIVVEDVERSAHPVPPSAPVTAPPAVESPAAVPPAVESPAVEQPAAVPPAERPVASPTGEEVESVPLTTIRRTIARRLGEAWQLPVFQLTVSVEMTHANALVEKSRELNPEVRVTVTDLLAKVCARALMRHRELNAQYGDEALLRFPSANIGLAVAAPQGLVVPVIASVERLSLVEVALRRGELVGRAREGRLNQADLEGGTFTISNLGMYGVEQFTAVLNPPQAAILAVGATVERPIARAGEVVIAPMLTMTLTVDHRAVDGGPAAAFLQTVKTFLEDPALAL
jgi:pyruvate dehydrogenase E2 component (dihydrolipoamide acetyltransferase)